MTHVLDSFTHRQELPDHGLIIGVTLVRGAGHRVATWDGIESRHMSPAAAKRFAAELMEGNHAEVLQPVHDALVAAADAAGRINAEADAMREAVTNHTAGGGSDD